MSVCLIGMGFSMCGLTTADGFPRSSLFGPSVQLGTEWNTSKLCETEVLQDKNCGSFFNKLNFERSPIVWHVACDIRAPCQLPHGYEAHQERSPFHPKQNLREVTFNGPIRFAHLPSVHDHGRQRSGTEPTWLYIEPFPCGRVRPAGDPVDSDPGAVFEDDPLSRSDAGRPLEPWVCRHTREPTVLSRLSCRPPHLNFDSFHQPCLLPGRTSNIGEDCRHRTTWRPLTPTGSPTLPPMRLTGGFFHADNTVPRKDVNSPSFTPLHVQVFAHT